MRIQEGHMHAIPVYAPISIFHFLSLFYSVIYGKIFQFKSVTQHLPFEIEHPQEFSSVRQKLGYYFIQYGELLKQIFHLNLYWENSPVLIVGVWCLKYGQTCWNNIPYDIDLCVDTGHLILGVKNKKEARNRIKKIFLERGAQIKHIHLHENDFKTDLHLKPFERNARERVFTRQLFKRITAQRSFIFEDPS